MSKTYGVLIDVDSPCDEDGHIWGYERFSDGVSVEKPMDEIIITAANYAAADVRKACCLTQPPESPEHPGYHFSWMGPSTFEEPKRTLGDDDQEHMHGA